MGASIQWEPEGQPLKRKTLRAGAGRTELQAIGTMLRRENERSLYHRYPSDDNVHLMYEHPPTRGTTPIQILASIRCYRYQACETPDYNESEAEAFCQALEAMVASIASEDAEWGAPESIAGVWKNALDPQSAHVLYLS